MGSYSFFGGVHPVCGKMQPS